MDTAALRSRLNHAVEELQYLTTQDLVECKWTVVQRVFTVLFERSASLRQYSDLICSLLESRNEELQSRRTSAENRAEWKEKNSNFKTNFMRIVIDGLSFLRWPPSLIAFSDPLENLLSDPKDAMNYLLEFGLPQETTRHTRIKRNERTGAGTGTGTSTDTTTPRVQQDREETNRQQKHVTSPSHTDMMPKSFNNEGVPREFESFYADESYDVSGPGFIHQTNTEGSYITEDGRNRRVSTCMPVHLIDILVCFCFSSTWI